MLSLPFGAGYLIGSLLAHYLRRFAGNYLNSVGMRFSYERKADAPQVPVRTKVEKAKQVRISQGDFPF